MTDEDRQALISKIEDYIGSRPCFYLKFCEEKKFADDVVNGKLFSNTPKHFRELELESGKRGQGDQYELISNINIDKVDLKDVTTGEIVMVATGGSLNIRYEDDDSRPMVSFVGISLKDMILDHANEKEAIFKLPFTEDEYAEMESKFGKYCVLIDARILENNINLYCNRNNCEYIFDSVIYCDQNQLDRIIAFNSCKKERFLYKNCDLSLQREYRLVLAQEMPKDHFINIDKLNNSIVIEAKKLKDFELSIDYHMVKKDKLNNAD